MKINKKILIPIAAVLALLIIGGVTILFLQPKKIDFWTHVDAYTKNTELQQKYNPDGWEIELIDVHQKETPDSDFVSLRLEDQTQIEELLDILDEIKVKDKPGDERQMGDYSYSIFISHSNYMDTILEFDAELDEMWIIFSYTSAPAYKIKNTSALQEYLDELFN